MSVKSEGDHFSNQSAYYANFWGGKWEHFINFHLIIVEVVAAKYFCIYYTYGTAS